MKFVTVDEMRQIESQADAGGLSYSLMMENAGKGVAEIIHQRVLPESAEKSALALVGPGNNGGDALVALSYLANWGWKVAAYLVKPRQKDPLVEQIEKAGTIVKHSSGSAAEKLAQLTQSSDVLLDGILGTGAKPPLRSDVGEVLDLVQSNLLSAPRRPFVVAVDCPSGIDCDTGAAPDNALKADLTVTMAAVKQGLFRFPAANLVGELKVASIGKLEGLPAWEAVNRFVADESWVCGILPARPADAHKGTFGTAIICAGSMNFTGAAWLAGQAAYRVGTGLVTVAIPQSLYTTLAGQFPEATWLVLPDELGVISGQAAPVLLDNLGKATALLLGPGWGQEDSTLEFLDRLLDPSQTAVGRPIGFSVSYSTQNKARPENSLPPVVVDADGLKLLSKIDKWHKRLPGPAVLTPHPGEMSVLTKLSKEEIGQDRISVAEKYSLSWGHVVVLKGAYTVVADPDGKTAIIPVATAALARAGTGDVLAGLITGLRAQGVGAFEAAVAGAWIHAQAGVLAALYYGTSASVIAGDVLKQVPEVIANLFPECHS
jgi:NAD(P)H-hydrate epimerase